MPEAAVITMRARRGESIKVRIPAADFARLQAIQEAIGSNPLTPTPSIHALCVRAIENYISQFQQGGVYGGASDSRHNGVGDPGAGTAEASGAAAGELRADHVQ